jgi:hypothetical protein
MCPILDGYGVTGIFEFPYTPWFEHRLPDQLAGHVLKFAGLSFAERCKHYFCQLTRAVHNRAAACFAAGGGIFENEL